MKKICYTIWKFRCVKM